MPIKPRTPTQSELAFALDQGRLVHEARAKKPSLADYQRELGSAVVVDKRNPDGTIEGRIIGHEASRRAQQMLSGWRKIERQRGKALSAAYPSERVKMHDGRTVEWPADRADQAGRAGRIRASVRLGGMRVYRDPETRLLVREAGGGRLERLNRCCLTTPVMPCGNPDCEACR